MARKQGAAVQIEGLDEIREKLREFGVKEGRAIMRNTIRAIAARIRKDAAANAPVDSGDMKKSLVVKARRSTPDNPIFEVQAGTKSGVKLDAFYWRFVEYGTSAGKNGHPGTAARPFIAPAVEAMRSQLPSFLQQEFGKKWEAAMKKTRKRAATPEGME